MKKPTSLNLEKDSSKLWSLAKVLNEEAPSCSKTVLRVRSTFLIDKKAANELAQLYRRESTLPPDSKESGRHEGETKAGRKAGKYPQSILNIRNLKPKKAPGPDCVSNDMLKHLGPIAR